jgi:DNA-binding XRE family transcriptional regulator
MDNDIKIESGKDLRIVRRKSGLSQYDLSKRSGYHEKTIQYTERGVPIGTDPRLRTFLDMVEACGYKIVAIPINGK